MNDFTLPETRYALSRDVNIPYQVMGDGPVDSHDQLAKQTIDRHRRAVRCALAFSTASRQIGLPLRAGLHTGEIELRGRDIGGIAVHAAARVMAKSQSSEVLV